MNKKIFILLVTVLAVIFPASGQVTEVTGSVTSAADQTPIPGVTIYIKGETTGTITDASGRYSLQVKKGDVLVFSFVGMETKEIPFTGQSTINVELTTSKESLDEVVVVGYGTRKKSLVTGAISTVTEADIDQGINLRAEQALQGRTAGVVITNNSGQPGDNVSIRIRGTSTPNGAQPLILVDGVPVGGIDYLNPGDIARIEVLKDAASSAIYGTRGANGVVLITTKQGSKNKPAQFRYDGYYGIQNPWRKMDLLNAKQYAQVLNEAYFNDNKPLPFSGDDILKLGAGTDWQEEVFYRNAPVTSHEFSVTGGTEKTAYATSFSYFSQDGIVAKGKSNFDRYTFRANGNHDLYNGRFKVSESVAYSHINRKGIDANGEWGSPLGRAVNLDPLTPVKNPDGSWGSSDYASQEIVNPVAALAYVNTNSQVDKFVGNISGEYEILKGLKLKSTYSIDLAYGIDDNYNPQYYITSNIKNDIAGVSKTINRWYTWNFDNILTYQKSFGDHNFNGLLGTTANKYQFQNLFGSKNTLLIDKARYAYLDMATNDLSASAAGGADFTSLLSYFGRVDYDYRNKYMATAVLRADGSSKFGSANKFGYFPSVSLGWNISEEDFLKDNPVVDYLKIRLGWGKNGNDNIDNFAYISTISSFYRYTFGNNPTIYPGSAPEKIANPELRWESTEQYDLGFDFRTLNNKLSLVLDLYNKKTNDILIPGVPIPALVGNNPPASNAGDVVNRGIEVDLGYTDRTGDFSYRVNLNGAYNHNEMTYIGNQEKILHGAGVATAMNDVTIAREGYPIGYFYGYQILGIFQNQAEVESYLNEEGKQVQPLAQPGDFKFADNNNDGVINGDDRIMLGDPNPDFTFGANLTASYKNFDLSIFLQGVAGNQIFNGTRRYDLPTSNWEVSVLDHWTGAGTSNTFPRLTVDDPNGNYSKASDFYIENGSYLRLKNMSLGYTLPENLLNKMKIAKIRFYLTGQNILTFTKYKGFDPEIGSADWVFNTGIDRGIYPQPRTFLLGVNVIF